MFVTLLLLLNVAGLAGFAFWLIRQISASRRSKIARRMMAQTLRASVRCQNAHQSIAALHERREIEVPTLESAMAARADLSARIEEIRLRVLGRVLASGEARNGRPAATNSYGPGSPFHTPARKLYEVSGVIGRPIFGNQA